MERYGGGGFAETPRYGDMDQMEDEPVQVMKKILSQHLTSFQRLNNVYPTTFIQRSNVKWMLLQR